MKLIALLLALTSFSAFSGVSGCERYAKNAHYMQSAEVVANNMKYTLDELCSLPRLMDIFIEPTQLVNEKNELIPHTWVTLHYNEYSCQYFVRDSDFVVTKKNCYNTW